MRTSIENGVTVIYLEGKITSENAQTIEEAFAEIGDSTCCIFDASGLIYISSAGLRILMKICKMLGNKLTIREVSKEVYDIFETTGFTEIFTVSKRMREVSIDDCELIGKGFYGTVYRLDDETIVKVYDSPESLTMIENEKRMAKAAFVKGIPTAISYDIVRVGNSYGAVFEMLKSKTFNDMVNDNPDNIETILKQYVNFIKMVHGTEMDHGSLPSAKKSYLEQLEKIKDYIGDERFQKLYTLVSDIPESDYVVHGDFQMKNVMMLEGEPSLIDMDTLSVGNCVFDLAGLYATYILFNESEPDNSLKFLELTKEISDTVWNKIVEYYFEGISKEETDKNVYKIRLASAIRFLYIIVSSNRINEPLGQTRLKVTLQHIDELLPIVDELAI